MTYKERSLLGLCLFLGQLNDILALILSLLIFHDVFAVLFALQVLCLLSQTLIVWQMPLPSYHNHEIFPVFDNNDDHDGELHGSDRSNRSQSISLALAILINQPLLILNNREC